MKGIHLLGVASPIVYLMLGAGVATAQTVSATRSIEPDTPVADIVVTAQKRSQSVQKVPLSVTALTSDALARAGAHDVSALADLVPGVQISSQDSFPLITIRGVGSVSADAYADPAVAFNVDGVYEGKGTSPSGLFYDLDRVEVLKGPQGTLYGRNATAGAINVITKDPTQTLGGNIEGEYGNYNNVRLEGALNVPINSTLAVRVAGQYLRHDGYLSSGYNDADTVALRAKVLWRPTDNLSILLSGDYTHVGGKGGSDVYYPFLDKKHPWSQPESLSGIINTPSGAVDVSLLQYQFGGGAVGSIPYYPRNGYTDNTNYGFSAKIDWDLGPVTLTVLPALRKTLTHSMTPVTGLITKLDFDDRQTTMEARLTSNDKGSSLQWIIGGYYLDETDPSTSLYSNPTYAELVIPNVGPVAEFLPINVAKNYNYIQNVVPDLTSRSEAVFGQATYTITRGVRLTGGLRYTADQKRQNGTSFLYDHFTTFPIVDNGTTPPQLEGFPGTYPLVTSKSWSAVTYKAGVDVDLGPRSIAYASFSTGYKSGGIYQNRPGQDTYKPEDLYAYTIGSKNTFWGGRLLLNAEAFYWIYKNHQLTAFLGDPLIPGAVVYATINAPRATVKGVDLDATLQLTRNDVLTANVEYLSGKFTDFTLPAGPPPAPTAPINYAGASLPYTPSWNAVVSYQHIFRIGSDYELTTEVDGRFVTHQQENFQAELPEDRFHGYSKINANISLSNGPGRWNASVWVRNITNVAVINYVNNVGQLPFFAGIEPPRTFGITIGKRF